MEERRWPRRFVHLSQRHVKQREAFWLIIGTQTGERHTPFLQLGARANALESGRHKNQENLKVKPFLGLRFNLFTSYILARADFTHMQRRGENQESRRGALAYVFQTQHSNDIFAIVEFINFRTLVF